MKGYGFLFWAYLVIWSGIAAYLMFLFGKLKRVDRRLAELERELDRRSER